jgi:NADH dehydrogenase
LARGHEVRALARPSGDYAGLQQAGAEIALGNVKDPPSLEQACAGVDVLITTATMSRRGDDSIENVDLQGNLNLVAAAERAGVRHFILVSTLGASPDSPVALFRAKGLAEQRLRESGMVHTILQPNPFMDVWFAMMVEGPVSAGAPVTLVGEVRRRHSFIAEQDVAAFAVAALRTPDARNATVALGGPEALTWLDVVAAYEAALGRRLPLRTVAPGDPIPGLPEAVWGLAASLESFDSPVPMDELARAYGVTLTGVREFARSRLELLGARPA